MIPNRVLGCLMHCRMGPGPMARVGRTSFEPCRGHYVGLPRLMALGRPGVVTSMQVDTYQKSESQMPQVLQLRDTGSEQRTP